MRVNKKIVPIVSGVAASAAMIGSLGLATVTQPAATTPTPVPVLGPFDTLQSGKTHYKTSTYTTPDKKKVLSRWNPCQTITYRINVNALPAKKRAAAIKDVHTAFTHVRNATGIPFRYKGTTSFKPAGTDWAKKTPAEIVVAWGTPTGKHAFPGVKWGKSVAGLGGSSYLAWATKYVNGKWTGWTGAYGRGQVLLRADLDGKPFKPGFGKGVTRGSLLLHEIGHVMGLSHHASKSVIMYPTIISRSKAAFQSGDLTGLKRLGRSSGCITIPKNMGIVSDLN